MTADQDGDAPDSASAGAPRGLFPLLAACSALGPVSTLLLIAALPAIREEFGASTAATQAAVNISDTRTWTTLPKEYQYCSFPTPVDGKLRVSAPNTQQAEVAVDPKSTNLILVRSVSPLSTLVVTAIRLK